MGWNNLAGFKNAVKGAAIDFDKEALVLIRSSQGSGSNRVTFEKGKLKKKALQYNINVKKPGHGMTGTADMAYYCSAIAVKKSAVNEVEILNNGKKSATLVLKQADVKAKAK